MKNDFIGQYGHTWRVFERIVKDFDNDSWIRTGRGTHTPVRLAFHVLQATRYYLEDMRPFVFASGKSVNDQCWVVGEKDLPSQDDILMCIEELKAETEEWLSEMDFDAENRAFGWAGKTKFGVALFLLRHNLYHIGQLSALLNESKNGDVDANYVKAL